MWEERSRFTPEWLSGGYHQAWCGAAPGHPGRILGRDGDGRQQGSQERSLQDQVEGHRTHRWLANRTIELTGQEALETDSL